MPVAAVPFTTRSTLDSDNSRCEGSRPTGLAVMLHFNGSATGSSSPVTSVDCQRVRARGIGRSTLPLALTWVIFSQRRPLAKMRSLPRRSCSTRPCRVGKNLDAFRSPTFRLKVIVGDGTSAGGTAPPVSRPLPARCALGPLRLSARRLRFPSRPTRCLVNIDCIGSDCRGAYPCRPIHIIGRNGVRASRRTSLSVRSTKSGRSIRRALLADRTACVAELPLLMDRFTDDSSWSRFAPAEVLVRSR